jgi:hypothetical protein
MVNFRKFNDFRDRPDQLAASALAMVSADVVSYYRVLEIKPRGLKKFETEHGQPLQRKKVDRSKKTAEVSGSGGKALSKFQGVVTKLKAVQKVSAAISMASFSSNLSESGKSSKSLVESLDSATDEVESQLTAHDSAESGRKGKKAELDLWDPTPLVPEYLLKQYAELEEATYNLGYQRMQVVKILKQGVPEASVEAVVENLVHASSMAGPLFCYKETAKTARPEKKKPTSEPSRTVSKDTRQSSLRLEDIDEEDLDDDNSTRRTSLSLPTSPSRSLAGTKENASIPGRSLRGTKESNFSSQRGGKSRGERGTKDTIPHSGRGRSERGTKDSTALTSLPSQRSLGTNPPLLKSSLKGGREQYASKDLAVTVRSDSPSPRANFPLPGEVSGASCTICYERPIDVELLPCRHRVACEQCISQSGSLCPLCRTFVTGKLKL